MKAVIYAVLKEKKRLPVIRLIHSADREKG
jgi:hypothetical protein